MSTLVLALLALAALAALNVAAFFGLRRIWPVASPAKRGITFLVRIEGADAAIAQLVALDSKLLRLWRAQADRVGREAVDYMRTRRVRVWADR